jgi:NADPH-dependent glutamate synthase beta subunit-like oxidoreductase/Pyruvate/2-oxoacid:ferredoxin oxidoreductase delta subunit
MSLPPTTWTTGFTDAIKTGTWRAARPAYAQRLSPCKQACPVNGDIAQWIGKARKGDWHGAWLTLVEHNPFPAIAGRVCHQPCESACNRGAYDEALAICSLERHVGDRALAAGWQFDQSPLGTERVAIVGGGPAGLSAAYQLRRRGYAVTLYEAQPQLGGLLRDGIPPYRLPRAVLDAEIERIVRMGIDVRCGVSIRNEDELGKLAASCEAVVLAAGARVQKRLKQLDYSQPWVMDSAAYLAQANAARAPALGRRIVVIGGGSAAMDVARSARRAGHEVRVLALESEAQMPAQREEVLAAREEGVEILTSGMLRAAKAGVRLQCVGVRFTAKPFEVAPLPGTEFELEADAIVTAIGADPQFAVQSKGIFAAGDVASAQRFVTHAVGMGKRVALEIDQWLSDSTPAPKIGDEPVALAAIATAYHPHAVRVCGTRADLTPRQALAEAARCFSCGTCTACDNCLVYCPDMAVRRVNGSYAIAADYCKGCGLCVHECPTGALAMQEEAK